MLGWVRASEDDIGTKDQPPLRKTMSTLGRFIGGPSEMPGRKEGGRDATAARSTSSSLRHTARDKPKVPVHQ
jgi:hypothetical protein